MKTRFSGLSLAAFCFILLFLTDSNAASDKLDVGEWLQKPDTRLFAVDFYASWCDPCKKAMPAWERLYKKYKDRGLRVVLVKVSSKAKCEWLESNFNGEICDDEGEIAKKWNVLNEAGNPSVPQAFLWDWRGNLLVSHGNVEQIAKKVEEYFNTSYSILVEDPTDLKGKVLSDSKFAAVKKHVESALIDLGKYEVVSNEKTKKKLRETKKKIMEDPNYAHEKCNVGDEIEPNSSLEINYDAAENALFLNLKSMNSGCQLKSADVVMGSDLKTSAYDAVSKLLKKLTSSYKMPEAGFSMDGKVDVFSGGFKATKEQLGTVEVHKFTAEEEGKTIVNKYTDTEGPLKVKTNIKEVEIYINGEPKGSTSETLIWQQKLPVGKKVVIGKKGSLWFPARKEIELTDDGAELYIELKPNWGKLDVRTYPDGATFTLRDSKKEYLSGVTPFKSDMIISGRYELIIKKDLYKTFSQIIELRDGKTFSINQTLEPDYGDIKIDSSPQGAKVIIDEIDTGETTPCVIRKATGTYKVRVQKQFYFPYDADVVLGNGKIAPVMAKLSKNFGAIEVSSNPSGAAIYLDGNDTGKVTPDVLDMVSSTVHTVECRLDRYYNDSKKVEVKIGEKSNVELKLQGKMGKISVEAYKVEEDGSEQPVDARIFIDERIVATNSFYKKDMLVGTYEVRAEYGDTEPFLKKVTITEGKTQPVKATLNVETNAQKMFKNEQRKKKELFNKQQKEMEQAVKGENWWKGEGRTLYLSLAYVASIGGVFAVDNYKTSEGDTPDDAVAGRTLYGMGFSLFTYFFKVPFIGLEYRYTHYFSNEPYSLERDGRLYGSEYYNGEYPLANDNNSYTAHSILFHLGYLSKIGFPIFYMGAIINEADGPILMKGEKKIDFKSFALGISALPTIPLDYDSRWSLNLGGKLEFSFNYKGFTYSRDMWEWSVNMLFTAGVGFDL